MKIIVSAFFIFYLGYDKLKKLPPLLSPLCRVDCKAPLTIYFSLIHQIQAKIIRPRENDLQGQPYMMDHYSFLYKCAQEFLKELGLLQPLLRQSFKTIYFTFLYRNFDSCINSKILSPNRIYKTRSSCLYSANLMKVTGHKTEKTFNKYIKITKIDAAKRLNAHIKKNWSGKLLRIAERPSTLIL